MPRYSLGGILPFQFISNKNTLSDAAEISFASPPLLPRDSLQEILSLAMKQ